MEGMLQQLYAECASNPMTKGIVLLEGDKAYDVFSEPVDAVFVVIREDSQNDRKYFNCSGLKVGLHLAAESDLLQGMRLETAQKMITWLSRGKVLLNRNGFLTRLRAVLNHITVEEQTKNIGMEFARFIGRFEGGKKRYTQGYYLDAFNHIQEGLHHLARFSILEKGIYVKMELWAQVKDIDAEIYKLYQELIVGEEDIEKRLELLIIALEFVVRSKMDAGVKHVLSIVKKEEKAWSYSDLVQKTSLFHYGSDLDILLRYLVDNDYIKKVEESSHIPGVFEYKYIHKK